MEFLINCTKAFFNKLHESLYIAINRMISAIACQALVSLLNHIHEWKKLSLRNCVFNNGLTTTSK